MGFFQASEMLPRKLACNVTIFHHCSKGKVVFVTYMYIYILKYSFSGYHKISNIQFVLYSRSCLSNLCQLPKKLCLTAACVLSAINFVLLEANPCMYTSSFCTFYFAWKYSRLTIFKYGVSGEISERLKKICTVSSSLSPGCYIFCAGQRALGV